MEAIPRIAKGVHLRSFMYEPFDSLFSVSGSLGLADSGGASERSFDPVDSGFSKSPNPLARILRQKSASVTLAKIQFPIDERYWVVSK